MKLAWRPCRLGESITLEGSKLGAHVGAALIGTLLMLALLLKVLSRGIMIMALHCCVLYWHCWTDVEVLSSLILLWLHLLSEYWLLSSYNYISDPPCKANQCPRLSGMTLLYSLEQIIWWTYRVKPPSPQSDSEQYVVWSILWIIYWSILASGHLPPSGPSKWCMYWNVI